MNHSSTVRELSLQEAMAQLELLYQGGATNCRIRMEVLRPQQQQEHQERPPPQQQQQQQRPLINHSTRLESNQQPQRKEEEEESVDRSSFYRYQQHTRHHQQQHSVSVVSSTRARSPSPGGGGGAPINIVDESNTNATNNTGIHKNKWGLAYQVPKDAFGSLKTPEQIAEDKADLQRRRSPERMGDVSADASRSHYVDPSLREQREAHKRAQLQQRTGGDANQQPTYSASNDSQAEFQDPYVQQSRMDEQDFRNSQIQPQPQHEAKNRAATQRDLTSPSVPVYRYNPADMTLSVSGGGSPISPPHPSNPDMTLEEYYNGGAAVSSHHAEPSHVHHQQHHEDPSRTEPQQWNFPHQQQQRQAPTAATNNRRPPASSKVERIPDPEPQFEQPPVATPSRATQRHATMSKPKHHDRPEPAQQQEERVFDHPQVSPPRRHVSFSSADCDNTPPPGPMVSMVRHQSPGVSQRRAVAPNSVPLEQTGGVEAMAMSPRRKMTVPPGPRDRSSHNGAHGLSFTPQGKNTTTTPKRGAPPTRSSSTPKRRGSTTPNSSRRSESSSYLSKNGTVRRTTKYNHIPSKIEKIQPADSSPQRRAKVNPFFFTNSGPGTTMLVASSGNEEPKGKNGVAWVV